MIKQSVSLLIAGITIGQTTVALALGKYKPPRDNKPVTGYTRSTGSRGECRQNTTIPLTLLAPYTHVGQTTSTHPLLAWYVPQGHSIPIQLSIYQKEANKRPLVVYQEELQGFQGIMQASIPGDRPGLKAGQRYIWEVAAICNRDRPSTHIVASAEIDVISKPKGDRRTLWYDVLKSSLNGNLEQGQLTRESLDLLTQLAELEKQAGNKGTKQGDRLMNIVLSGSHRVKHK